jgi:hypothetical protein
VAALNAWGQTRDQTALVVLGSWPEALRCNGTVALPGP